MIEAAPFLKVETVGIALFFHRATLGGVESSVPGVQYATVYK